MANLLDKESYKLIILRRKALINHLWFSLLRDAWLHNYKVEKLYSPDIDYVPPNKSKLQIPEAESQSLLLTYGGFVFGRGVH